MWIRWRHRLEERPEHLAALVADVAHHLELFVDDHEELVDLLLVAQELRAAGSRSRRSSPSGGRTRKVPRDRVHPDVAAVHADVPLGAGADQVAVAGEEAGTSSRRRARARAAGGRRVERLVGAPVGDDRAVVAADDQVGALALPDLVLDDRLDDLGVVLVVGRRSRRGRRTRRPPSSIASITSATENSRSVSTSTTTSGVPSSCASNPRSATWRNGTATSRSHMPPGGGGPSSSGMSMIESATQRRPPSRPTVSRSPARVERRMIAHASCPWRAAMASLAEVGMAFMSEA